MYNYQKICKLLSQQNEALAYTNHSLRKSFITII